MFDMGAFFFGFLIDLNLIFYYGFICYKYSPKLLAAIWILINC